MPGFDIAGRAKIWFIISLLIIIPGLISMVTRGFNFGIDFTGGTIIDLKFEQAVEISKVRDALRPFGLDGATIQLSGDSSDVASSTNVMIRTVDLEENQRKEVMAGLKSAVGNYDVLREEKVGATIGGELIFNAVMALVISWVLIILYIAYRFEFKFGVSAIVALIHDILIVLAIFSFTQKQIDSSFVAALLTIVGYSINDTIVIFDRIRECRDCQSFGLSNFDALILHGVYLLVYDACTLFFRRRYNQRFCICIDDWIYKRLLLFNFYCRTFLVDA